MFTLNPDYRSERYESAYEGKGDLPVPVEHSYVYQSPMERLRLESIAFRLPPPRLTPAEKIALRWIKRHAPKDAVIVDCGCGTGRFLRALKRASVQGVGVDISEELIDELCRVGLKAVVGKAPDFPWNNKPPFGITFFEVLEHLPTPVDILQALHSRFPQTVILASVPSPFRPGLVLKGRRGLSDYPPNHFLRWTPQALEKALERAGYSRVEVILPPPVGSEMLPGLGQLVFKLKAKRKRSLTSTKLIAMTPKLRARNHPFERIGITGLLWLHRSYQVIADTLGRWKASYAQKKGASASSMLVIAQP
jgi:SAM-dependent methyltransferase